jgi:hypothetical protein
VSREALIVLVFFGCGVTQILTEATWEPSTTLGKCVKELAIAPFRAFTYWCVFYWFGLVTL